MLKIAVQSGGGWFNEKDPEGSFRYIRECGFDAVDFNINNKLPSDKLKKGILTDFFDQPIEDIIEYYRPIKEAAEKTGVSFCQMHAPFPLWLADNDVVNDYTIMSVEKICAVCQFVGCPALVVHPVTLYDAPKEKEIEVNMNMYRRMIPAGKKYGVKLCLENLFVSYNGRMVEGSCSTATEACFYIDALNAEANADVFGFCFDVGHANLMGRNMRQYLNALGDRLTVLHIHDNDGANDLHMMPYSYVRNYGKDIVCDWEGFINGLHDIGYTGAICFETFRVLGSYPKELHADALRLISATGKYFANRVNPD